MISQQLGIALTSIKLRVCISHLNNQLFLPRSNFDMCTGYNVIYGDCDPVSTLHNRLKNE